MIKEFNPFTLKGKTILITGASSGIGKSISIICSKMGAHVIITGRNPERLNQTFESLVGDGHIAITSDINNPDDVESLISNLPKLDGMVLAAGIVEMRPIMFASYEKLVSIYETNLFAPVQMLRLIVKKKKYNGGFSVVAISSVAGREDIVPGNGIYGSGKSALSSILKYASIELAPKSIRINTVSPGMILTPMHTQGDISQDELDQCVERIPMKRWGIPDEIAYASVFLLSNASEYMTGSDIKVDGGLTI